MCTLIIFRTNNVGKTEHGRRNSMNRRRGHGWKTEKVITINITSGVDQLKLGRSQMHTCICKQEKAQILSSFYQKSALVESILMLALTKAYMRQMHSVISRHFPAYQQNLQRTSSCGVRNYGQIMLQHLSGKLQTHSVWMRRQKLTQDQYEGCSQFQLHIQPSGIRWRKNIPVRQATSSLCFSYECGHTLYSQ